MSLFPMNLLRNSEKSFQAGFVLLLLLWLAGSAVSLAGDQKKAPPAPKAPAPKASTPRAPTSKPSTNRPATGTHTTSTGRSGTASKNSTPRKTGSGSTMGRTGGNAPRGNVTKAAMKPVPGRQVSLKGGGTASIRPNGQIRSINRNGMRIDHGLNGSRHIESTHNGARIVTTGRGRGYVQRPYVTRGGRTYVSRTVVVNHVAYARVYRSYSYHGYCCYYGYHPAYYYGPAYYGWAYHPWATPVYYGWGWGGAPWYGYYGGYFAPYPTYPSAAFWLTDYLLAANLQAAYQAQAASNAAAGNAPENAGSNDAAPSQGSGDTQAASSGSVTLTPEVKAAIAEEVKAQLAAEQAEAKPADSGGGQQTTQPSSTQPSSTQSSSTQSSSTQSSSSPATEEVPAALDPARRTFVVASDLAVTGDGQECQLSAGDVITRITDTPDDDRKVTVSVAASKKTDCAAGKQVAVAVDDLQEMHNHFQEQLDNGMKDLSSKQGTGGLPKAPDATPVASDVPPPPPDASAEKALQDQQASADQVEAQVAKEAFSQGS
ncbi:MAG TPA: hypothetical protein VGM18_15485 [Candidatus Sulfotelmatobacter sp.]